MQLRELLERNGVSIRALAKGTGISKSVIHRLTQNEVPQRDAGRIRELVSRELAAQGIDTTDLVWPVQAVEDPTKGIELMQFDRAVMQFFGLRKNPFLRDIEADGDVLRFRGYETVETAIRDTIEQRGFLAISADSGAGKTTVWDGIEAECREREDVVICKPLVKSRETMTAEHLTRALIYGLAGDDIRIPRDAEDRGRLLSRLLRNVRSGEQDRRVVLMIDDAHFCTMQVLRQLKTFFEEKLGRYPVLGIVLIGLPTLKTKLGQFPEIGNRIRLVEMPLVKIEEYLEFKLSRVGSTVDRIFDEGGWAAFCERFKTGPRRPAMGRPLVINSMVIRAMVRLHANGAAPNERITREIIDSLPGEAAVRKAA